MSGGQIPHATMNTTFGGLNTLLCESEIAASSFCC